MDTLKILLGATVALLLGALAVSYNNQSAAPAKPSASASDQTEILRQIEELRLEQDRLQIEKQRMEIQQAAAQAPPVAAPVAEPSEIAAMQAQIAELEKDKEKALRDAETADREAAFVGGKMLEGRDQEARRARMIRDSLVIARIKEWIEDPQYGGFATIDVIMPDNVQPGSILCIRRNTGILGRLRVGEMNIDGAIANPLGSFPEAQPQAGDELILEPPF
jgi:hypothetical protein